MGNPSYGAGFHQGFEEGVQSKEGDWSLGAMVGAVGGAAVVGLVHWGPRGFRKIKASLKAKRESVADGKPGNPTSDDGDKYLGGPRS